MIGFNIGTNLSLGDIDLAIEYLANNGGVKDRKPESPWEPKIAEIVDFKSVQEDKEEDLKKQLEELKKQRLEAIEREIAEEKAKIEADRERLRKEAEEEKKKIIEEREKLRLEELRREEQKREAILQREEEAILQREEEEKLAELKRLREKRQEEIKRMEEQKKAVAFDIDALEIPELGIEKAEEEPKLDKKIYYKTLDIDSLYAEVKKFMKANGVERAVIDKTVLEYEFGADSIKKLIVKSYLITVRKGVTAGR